MLSEQGVLEQGVLVEEVQLSDSSESSLLRACYCASGFVAA